jgi:hypothetical protein
MNKKGGVEIRVFRSGGVLLVKKGCAQCQLWLSIDLSIAPTTKYFGSTIKLAITV